jgi:hypothetical protein
MRTWEVARRNIPLERRFQLHCEQAITARVADESVVGRARRTHIVR